METIKEVWSGILDYLHNLDDISEVAYNVWITCIEPRTIEDGEWWCSFTPTSRRKSSASITRTS